MWTYIARRLLYAIPILFGVMLLTFVIFFTVSSPRALARSELEKSAKPDQIAAWLRSKGYAELTPEGEAKLAKIDDLEKLSSKLAELDNTERETKLIKDNAGERSEARVRGLKAAGMAGGAAPANAADILGEVAESDSSPEAVAKRAADAAAAAVAPKVQAAEKALKAAEDAAKEAAKKKAEADKAAGVKASGEPTPPDPAVAAKQKELAAVSGEADEAQSKQTEANAAYFTARLKVAEAEGAATPAADAAAVAASKARIAALADYKAAADAALKISQLEEEMGGVRAGIGKLKITAKDTVEFGMGRLFVKYITDLLTFNFGDTKYKRPVTEILSTGMWPSLKLMIPAFFLAEFIALALALFAALYRGTKVDRSLVVISVFFMSFSSIAVVMFCQKFFAAEWSYFPIAGYEPGLIGYAYLILPMLIYVLINFGPELRFNRILMLDEIGQDYVRTAKAKGVGQNSILFRHVLRNGLIPLITRWAVIIPNLYLGSLVLETFFAIPGLGGILVQAITNRDVNMIRALVFIGTIMYIFSTLLADVLYAVVDPRVKLK